MAAVESLTEREESPHISLQVTCDFTVSPTQAGEEVIALLVRHAGLAIYAGEPTRFRIAEGRVFWLVPLFVALPRPRGVRTENKQRVHVPVVAGQVAQFDQTGCGQPPRQFTQHD